VRVIWNRAFGGIFGSVFESRRSGAGSDRG
jgi:hypothetical protein